jgi:hypothetical protein
MYVMLTMKHYLIGLRSKEEMNKKQRMKNVYYNEFLQVEVPILLKTVNCSGFKLFTLSHILDMVGKFDYTFKFFLDCFVFASWQNV